MAKYFGFRGPRLLDFMLYTIVVPVYIWFGYNAAAAGGILNLKSFISLFPSIDTLDTTGHEKTHNAQIQGTFVALYPAGCIFGSMSCVIVGDRLGRIKTGFIGAVIATIGHILQGSAFSLGQLMAGRIISGLGYGMVTATVPLWQAECSTARHRGTFIVMEGIYICVGLAFSQWLGLGMSFVGSSGSWRLQLVFPTLNGLIVIAFILFCPESPRWLVKVGRVQDAREVLAVLEDISPDDMSITISIESYQASLEETGKGSFLGLFKNGRERIFHRTMIAAVCLMFQQ
ncbi:glucose-inactivated glycerol proton symporter STL1 [Sugiyamaella lignohabitans]|uniref:Glucose-inactivated glycerol proton symporter STL1 n=1 Tax=Sugiyamaella lignohabitans TaxID=796027 RepID=A0A161HNW2_9ASCO|nr:glucose-inactivated glycerol proton symporter STL1 [Sugiyamaella lignohabitans]ANB15907.1 glucose-inactivated glycerol proton symporter STL1 [Sugiyamaella lignohabitans]